MHIFSNQNNSCMLVYNGLQKLNTVRNYFSKSTMRKLRTAGHGDAWHSNKACSGISTAVVPKRQRRASRGTVVVQEVRARKGPPAAPSCKAQAFASAHTVANTTPMIIDDLIVPGILSRLARIEERKHWDRPLLGAQKRSEKACASELVNLRRGLVDICRDIERHLTHNWSSNALSGMAERVLEIGVDTLQQFVAEELPQLGAERTETSS
ncbi:hypothetical protein B0H10DRAFT_2253485 [Mycena sp. CBHHK59/15]|nr:hypothetical protein B0H10DRAFT_2253485 [Mycena sp. CBHHK59/15]